MRCAVVGAGAWGTALADLLARNGHDVALWAREPEVVASVNAQHENTTFLAGATLHAGVVAHADLASACRGAALVLFATPSHVLRSIARTAAPAIGADATIVVATKGVERDTLAVMSDVLAEQYPAHAVVALSGPSFAAEVVARQPTAVVAASSSGTAATMVQRALSGDEFRVYTHDDVIGVELGGALKNVIAVATGIAEGLGMGFNARAALITRGLAEMTRLGVKMGASPLTFAGLAGMGDLVLTCTGALSRNRSLGVEIARGESLDEALAKRQTVAEGVMTTHSARALAAREGIEMPIVSAVYRILFEHQPPRAAIGELMRRELRAEGDT
jgi:glycerol-3-phosphate dehydrogenase (NAD(P)+)